MKAWKIDGQGEFDFDDCYIQNYPPLDLSKYKNDRNYLFYVYQNDLLMEFNKTGKTNHTTLWKMFPYIEGVVESVAKKNICTGCRVPNFSEKCFEACIRILKHYETFPYFRAKKLENVAFHKVREVFLDGNLQINERAKDWNTVVENITEREAPDYNKKKQEKTLSEIKSERLEEEEMKEIRDFYNWCKTKENKTK